jgi:putative transposase
MRHDLPPSSPLDLAGGPVSQEGGRVKKSRFDDTQIINILREQEGGTPAAEVCRRHGITEQTFYRWKAKHYRVGLADAEKLRSLQDENRRLRKVVMDVMLEVAALKERLENG